MGTKKAKYCSLKKKEVVIDDTTGCNTGHYECDDAECMYSPKFNMANGIGRILFNDAPKGRDYTK
jgi:hypothetical protein